MSPIRFIGLPLLPLLLLLGCGPKPNPTPTEQVTLSPEATQRARALYESQGCAVCHGQNAEGVEEVGPALEKLAPYWDEQRLVAYLRDPSAFRKSNPDFEDRRAEPFSLEMPEFSHLESEELELLSRWLLTR